MDMMINLSQNTISEANNRMNRYTFLPHGLVSLVVLTFSKFVVTTLNVLTKRITYRIVSPKDAHRKANSAGHDQIVSLVAVKSWCVLFCQDISVCKLRKIMVIL